MHPVYVYNIESANGAASISQYIRYFTHRTILHSVFE